MDVVKLQYHNIMQRLLQEDVGARTLHIHDACMLMSGRIQNMHRAAEKSLFHVHAMLM